MAKTLTDVETLLSTFEALALQHGLNVEIDPQSFSISAPAAIDIEHDEEGNLVGIGIYDGQKSLFFTSINERLCNLFLSMGWIAHNGKGDFEQLRAWGIPISDSQLIWDTELLAHIIDSSRRVYGLKKLAEEDLGITYPSYQDLVGSRTAKERRTLDKLPVRLVALYNAFDCYVTYKLWEQQGNVTNPYPGISDYFEQLEKPASYVFQSMENRGIRLDLPYLNDLKAKLEAQQRPIKDSILNELGSINLNSPKQLLEALHAKEIRPVLKGKPSTDKRALESFKEVPIIKNLLHFSELDTLLSSFVYPYLERGTEVVHPFYNQCGTRTGRPSCSNPNLLQIPKRTENGKLVRRMFIPRDGLLFGDCDYGQIEPRVLAHLSKDPAMLQMFNDGTDFHDFTATRLGISRDRAKVLNLSVGYRATFKSVMSQLRCSKDEAQEQINNWWRLFPHLRQWQEDRIFESKRSGFCTTLFGRRIRVDGLDANNSWTKEAAERQLINNVTQGSAAEIIKKAMIRLSTDARLSPSFGLLVQVYDELLWESKDVEHDKEFVIEDMIRAIELDVPLVVDCKTGDSWATCH